MSNMSYCRFENTFNDLADCYEVLCDEGFDELVEETGELERVYVQKLINLCELISREFGHE